MDTMERVRLPRFLSKVFAARPVGGPLEATSHVSARPKTRILTDDFPGRRNPLPALRVPRLLRSLTATGRRVRGVFSCLSIRPAGRSAAQHLKSHNTGR